MLNKQQIVLLLGYGFFLLMTASVVGRKLNRAERSNKKMTAKNSGKPWSPNDVSTLNNLATKNTPTRVIGLKMGRTPDAVQSQASKSGISLKPTNQSPYGTKKK
jgi:hypothetical protein